MNVALRGNLFVLLKLILLMQIQSKLFASSKSLLYLNYKIALLPHFLKGLPLLCFYLSSFLVDLKLAHVSDLYLTSPIGEVFSSKGWRLPPISGVEDELNQFIFCISPQRNKDFQRNDLILLRANYFDKEQKPSDSDRLSTRCNYFPESFRPAVAFLNPLFMHN